MAEMRYEEDWRGKVIYLFLISISLNKLNDRIFIIVIEVIIKDSELIALIK